MRCHNESLMIYNNRAVNSEYYTAAVFQEPYIEIYIKAIYSFNLYLYLSDPRCVQKLLLASLMAKGVLLFQCTFSPMLLWEHEPLPAGLL